MNIKTAHLKTITASIIVAVGLWVGLTGNCLAEVWYTNDQSGAGATLGTSTYKRIASKYVPGQNRNLCHVQFEILEVGSRSDNVYAQLIHTGSNPFDGHLQATSDAVPGADLVGDPEQFVSFTFDPCETLTSGETYWLTIGYTGSPDASNYYTVTSGNSNPGISWWYTSNDINWTENAAYSNSLKLDDEGYTPPYDPATISITYPVDESDSQAEYWTVDADTNDYTSATSTDQIKLVVRYAKSAHCAENACLDEEGYADSIYSIKEVAACDAASSTYDGETNLTQFATLDNDSTYWARAYIVGYSAEECTQATPNEYIIAESETIYFTYNSDYLSGLDDADTFWANGWGGMWGAATSTPGYAYGKNMIDYVAKPVLNIGAVWSTIFHPDQATNWGITAGENIKTMLQKIGGFFNIIPDFQLFTVLFVAIIFDLAIFFFRLFYRARRLLPK